MEHQRTPNGDQRTQLPQAAAPTQPEAGANSSTLIAESSDTNSRDQAAQELLRRAQSRDFAWRVHAATVDWIGKVDSKAWIGFSLQAALIGLVVNLSIEPQRPFGSLTGWQVWVFRLALGVLALGVIVAGGVVFPQLRRRHRPAVQGAGSANLIPTDGHGVDLLYFGTMRFYDGADVSDRLMQLTPEQELDMLGVQLAILAKIAWFKHRLLQVSMILWLVGSLLLVVAAQ